MSANTSSTYEFTIDQVVRQALILASQMSMEEPAAGVQWEQRRQVCLGFLETIVKRIEAQGKLVRARKFLLVTMVASQSEYVLDSSIMDVFEDGMFIPADQPIDAANGETPVRQIDMESWQRLAARAALGRPTLYFVYRAADPLTIRVWPTPSAAEAGTIRFQVYRFLGNSTDGAKNVDLERYWANYVTYALATMIAEASNQPREKVMGLQGTAESLLIEAKSYSHQRTPGQVVVTHRGPYQAGRHYR